MPKMKFAFTRKFPWQKVPIIRNDTPVVLPYTFNFTTAGGKCLNGFQLVLVPLYEAKMTRKEFGPESTRSFVKPEMLLPSIIPRYVGAVKVLRALLYRSPFVCARVFTMQS